MTTALPSSGVTPVGRVTYVSLNEPQVDQYKPGTLLWKCGLELTSEESAPLLQLCDDITQQAVEKDQKFAQAVKAGTKIHLPWKQSTNTKPDGTKEIKEGYLTWNFKRNSVKGSPSGEKRQETAPLLWDAAGVECNSQVGSGTKGRVKFTFYAYSRMSYGIYFELQEFQIQELVAPGGAPTPGFDALPTGYTVQKDEGLQVISSEF